MLTKNHRYICHLPFVKKEAQFKMKAAQFKMKAIRKLRLCGSVGRASSLGVISSTAEIGSGSSKEKERQKDQSHPWLHSEFEASLDYISPYIKNTWITLKQSSLINHWVKTAHKRVGRLLKLPYNHTMERKYWCMLSWMKLEGSVFSDGSQI